VIEVTELVFAYPGAKEPAVDGLEFSVADGEVFGFLGPKCGEEHHPEGADGLAP
jgi:ABC-type multidrug transport system ATPase subunit